MSFNIGQLRKKNFQSATWLSPVTKPSWATRTVTPLTGIQYDNRYLVLNTGNDTSSVKNYFLTINFPRFNTGDFSEGGQNNYYQEYSYNVYLAQLDGNTLTKIKLIKSFTVEAHNDETVNYVKNIQIFFTINNDLNNLIIYFELVPTLYDYQHNNNSEGGAKRLQKIWSASYEDQEDAHYRQKAPIPTIIEFCKINNMLPNSLIVQKMGIQTRPGVLLTVNRQPIRVGRSGIYEIYNGIDIYQVAIITPGASDDYNKMDSFIIDYAYQS